MDYLPFVVALAWSALAWRNPRWAVLGLPALLPLYVWRTHLGPLPTTALELAFAATAIGATARLGLKPWLEGWRRSVPWRWPLLAWIAATLVAAWVAPDHLAAFGLWRAFILEPLAYFVLLQAFLAKGQDRLFVIRALAASAIFVFVWCAVQYLTGRGIPHPWDTDFLTRRATGPFPFPNAVSLYCAPLAALFFGLALENRDLGRGEAGPNARSQDTPSGTGRCMFWLAFAAATLATLLAKSVGGTLGIFAAVTLTLVLKRSTRHWMLGSLLLGSLIVFSVPQLRVPTVKTLSFDGWSGRVRVWMWQETWQMLKDRPILGAGLGAYPDVFRPYHKKTFIEIFQYPHNVVLNLWSETGILGVLVFAWIVGVWLRISLPSRNPGHALPATLLPLIAILIQGLVDVPYFKNDLAFAFWTLAALATFRPDRPTASPLPYET